MYQFVKLGVFAAGLAVLGLGVSPPAKAQDQSLCVEAFQYRLAQAPDQVLALVLEAARSCPSEVAAIAAAAAAANPEQANSIAFALAALMPDASAEIAAAVAGATGQPVDGFLTTTTAAADNAGRFITRPAGNAPRPSPEPIPPFPTNAENSSGSGGGGMSDSGDES